jgi:hypothetical protein
MQTNGDLNTTGSRSRTPREETIHETERSPYSPRSDSNNVLLLLV